MTKVKKKRTTLIQKFHRKSPNTRGNIFVFVSLILVMGLLGVFALVTWLSKLAMISMSIFALLLCVTTIVYVAGYIILAKKVWEQDIYRGFGSTIIFSVMMLWIGLGLAWIVYTNY